MDKKFMKYKDFTVKKRMDLVREEKFAPNGPEGEYKERISNPSREIIQWNGNIKSKTPPHLDPEDRANELLKIKGYIQSVGEKQAKSDAERYDKGTIKKFKKLCEQLGLEFNKKYFKQLKEEAKDFILIEKYKWNIPRPYQTAKTLNIPFDECYEIESSNSPSYPSGHSFYSYIIAETLSKLHPEKREAFLRLANLVALSRMASGVHYMEDLKEGKRLASVLVESGTVKLPPSSQE